MSLEDRKEIRELMVGMLRSISRLTQTKNIPWSASPQQIANALLDRLEKIDEVCKMAIEGLSGERRGVPFVCAKCHQPMQFADGLCWKCYGGDPGQ